MRTAMSTAACAVLLQGSSLRWALSYSHRHYLIDLMGLTCELSLRLQNEVRRLDF